MHLLKTAYDGKFFTLNAYLGENFLKISILIEHFVNLMFWAEQLKEFGLTVQVYVSTSKKSCWQCEPFQVLFKGPGEGWGDFLELKILNN